jgi:pteridine reductase
VRGRGGLLTDTILVTGGALRVGAAITRAVAESGAALAIHCHSHRREAEALARELQSTAADVVVVQADLMNPETIPTLFDTVEERLGPITGLVNSAGIYGRTALVSLDTDLALKMFRLNSLAPLATMAELARREPASASIVNVIDSMVDGAWRHHSAYIASKAALLAATRVAARELAPSIRVNAVSPGAVALNDDDEAVRASIVRQIPLGRIGTPDEVAQVVLFLLKQSYVTGTVVKVDGGRALV